jgi:hypothetical protein
MISSLDGVSQRKTFKKIFSWASRSKMIKKLIDHDFDCYLISPHSNGFRNPTFTQW